MITPKEHRRDKLLSHGVPAAFLDSIDTPPFEDLELIFRFPDAAYHYLPTIESTYSILRGYHITPVFDGANGDTFWALLSTSSDARFVHFELEQDEIYKDYGANFMLLLADMVILLYESADDLNASQIAEVARSIGFSQADKLISALVSADEHGLRKSFASDAEWRSNNLPGIVTDGN